MLLSEQDYYLTSGVSLLHFTDRCTEGEVRLVGGGTEMEGRVEVCTSLLRWGTVCNKQWTPSHTKVVCRQLGYNDSEGMHD